VNTFDAIWKKLRRTKRYREQFVADHAKRAIPHQARSIMKARGLNQQELAKLCGLSQGVVSRAVDPSYGNLTLNTIIRVAAGLDLAFVGRFVPFSELARWYTDLPNQDWNIPTFEEEDDCLPVVQSEMLPSRQRVADPLLQWTVSGNLDKRSTAGLPSLNEAQVLGERMAGHNQRLSGGPGTFAPARRCISDLQRPEDQAA